MDSANYQHLSEEPTPETVSMKEGFGSPIILVTLILTLFLTMLSIFTIVCVKTKIFSSGNPCRTFKKRSIESDSMLNLSEHESTEHVETSITDRSLEVVIHNES